MRLTAIEVTTVAGQKVRLELDVPIGEDLKGFDFSRWFHHFWIHYGRYLDGPLPRVVTKSSIEGDLGDEKAYSTDLTWSARGVGRRDDDSLR